MTIQYHENGVGRFYECSLCDKVARVGAGLQEHHGIEDCIRYVADQIRMITEAKI